jgi:hypothetical protein
MHHSVSPIQVASQFRNTDGGASAVYYCQLIGSYQR